MTSPGRYLHPEPWDLPSPTVRDAAQQRLTNLIDRVADGRAHCLWIEGEAGVGKTALLEALTARAVERGCLVLRADCPFPAEGDLPWPRMLAGANPPLRFDLVARSLGKEVLRELGSIVPAFSSPSPGRAPPPGLRASDHAQRRWRCLARLLEVVSRRTPIILAIDDVHRAGEELIQQISFLFRSLAPAALLWIVAGEPDDPSGKVAALRRTLERLRRLETISLGAFSAEETRRFLAGWIDPNDLDRLATWLMEKTGGHPLFLREVVRGLIDAGRIVPAEEEGRHALAGELDAVPIPPSLEGLMRERLRGLTEPALGLLRALAAAGGEGSPSMLARIAGARVRESEAAMRLLLASDLVERSPLGRGLVQIRQDWLGQVALASFHEPPVEELRLRAADLLAGERVLGHLPRSVRLSRRARALEGAGERHWARAAEAHADAARAAWEEHSQGAARSHIERALAILDETAPAVRKPEQEKVYRRLEEEICELGGRIHTMIGPFRKGVEELERLRTCLDLRRPAPRPSRWVSLELQLGLAHRNLGQYEEALGCYERALRRAAGKQGERLRADVHLEIAWVHYERGNHDEALRAVRTAARTVRRLGTALDYCRARNLEGLITWAQSRPLQAERIFRDALRRLEPLGTVPLVAAVWNNLGLVHWNLGSLDEATRCLTRARRIRIEMGQLLGEAVSIANLALVEEDRGNFEASARLHRQALRIRESLGDRRGVVIGLGNLANILRQTGEREEASDLAERALTECRAIGVTGLEPGLLCTCSGIHRMLGDPKRALEEADRAVAIARSFNNRRLVAYGLENGARAAAALGHPGSARAKMKSAKEAIQPGSPIDLATILLSEAEMLKEIAERAGKGSRASLLAQAKRSASEAVALFQKHDAEARIERAATLLTALGLLPGRKGARSHAVVRHSGVPKTAVQIFCFGPLRIVTPAGTEIGPGDWGSHKARAIFAYLLFHRAEGSGVPRERILEAIWPEAPLDTVENTFHATLALLRRALAGAAAGEDVWASVVHTGGCYRLTFSAEPWIDCLALERGIRDGARWQREANYFRALEAYRAAESLYQADFLEDSYQSWTDPFRDRYRQDHQDLLLRLGILALEMWSPAEALEWIGKLRAIDPLDERACRLGMRAQVAAGRRKAAIDLYRGFVKQLKEELGVDPEPETVETYRGLRSGVALPPLVPPEQPGSLRSFGAI